MEDTKYPGCMILCTLHFPYPGPQREIEKTPSKMEAADSNKTVYVLWLDYYQLQCTWLDVYILNQFCSIFLIDIHRVSPQAAKSTTKPLPKPAVKPKVYYLPFIFINFRSKPPVFFTFYSGVFQRWWDIQRTSWFRYWRKYGVIWCMAASLITSNVPPEYW